LSFHMNMVGLGGCQGVIKEAAFGDTINQ
jgi:hypothetical protein